MLGKRKQRQSYASYFTYLEGPPRNFLEILNEGRRLAYETIVDFKKDYIGQKTVRLVRAYPFEEPLFSQDEALSLWSDYLSKNETKITTAEVAEPNQELVDNLATQVNLERLDLLDGDYYDVSSLTALPKLKFLTLDGVPDGIDFSPLAKIPTLKALRAFSRRPINFDSLSQLTQLEGLELGSGIDPAFMGYIKVDNFNFLRPLTNLKKLRTDDLRPIDKDLTPLLSLDNLEEAIYVYFKGQYPSVQDMALAHPAFEQVHKIYLEIKSGKYD